MASAWADPAGKTKKVTQPGVDDATNHLDVFTVLRADSHEAAAKLFENHPHFAIFPDDSVEIMPVLHVYGKAGLARLQSAVNASISNCPTGVFCIAFPLIPSLYRNSHRDIGFAPGVRAHQCQYRRSRFIFTGSKLDFLKYPAFLISAVWRAISSAKHSENSSQGLLGRRHYLFFLGLNSAYRGGSYAFGPL